MNPENILRRISKSIHATDSNAEAFLFGSRARGSNRSDSDWDILILIDNTDITNDIEDMFRDELYDIELETGQIISTMIYSKSFWNTSLVYSPLYQNVKSEGIRI